LAIPVSFGIAIFLTEMAPPWLKRPVGVAIELLAAVPSIIYGIWGLFVLAPILQRHVQPWLIAWLGPLPVIGRLFQGPPYGIGISLLAPGTTSSASIANEFTEAVGDLYSSSLIALGALLFLITFSVIAAARFMLLRLEHRALSSV